MTKLNSLLLFAGLTSATLVLPSMASMIPGMALASAHAEQKTKRVPALRDKVYSQLARAQKLADDGDVKGGLAALDSVKERASSMNSYEKAMMYNFYGFIYYNENRLGEAIDAFENVVAQTDIPESLTLSTLFSLAQLSMANDDYQGVIDYLTRWDKVNTKAQPDSYYVLKSQAYYQMSQYQDALAAINTAIALAEKDGKTPKENWLVLQRALYYSLQQPEQVVAVIEKMIALYNKPEYWLQLSGMYGEVGREKEQLATIEAAYQQGFVTSKSDLRNLAQVYMFNGLPYKAAKVMKTAQAKGVVADNVKNNAFIAEAFVQAKEERKSLAYFEKAAKQSQEGIYDQRLAEVHLNLEQYAEAADAARAALEKGGLQHESNAYVALGMAQFNLQNFDASILAFEQAEKHKRSERLAQQWIKYVKNEKLHAETLKQALL
ncbi:tetratricopeptide repeat protein [Pseudoalteromonas sp. Cnat2-41]|uniref:tetratricopeptide repeat protein n=1 Tax=unclassified Pseudoalteromonas TaxID=194690 RepID=UPI001EF7F214|nr:MULTISPECIES: tetratricopeptide repeat protein [unclassified Pseudoalteromonas]MCF2860706.1 tetratricopeptide repeat protein [Pseudoalteromonas sp. CNAT2-18]MCG7556575.1 tetratricopeptide repeat protein [Pseudoalteromonas sp. CNAT2-18.1]